MAIFQQLRTITYLLAAQITSGLPTIQTIGCLVHHGTTGFSPQGIWLIVSSHCAFRIAVVAEPKFIRSVGQL